MNKKIRYRIFVSLLAIFLSCSFLISNIASAKTTCSRTDCKITITINIAFAGATQDQMNKWVNEIKSVWNQANQTTGKCKCEVKVDVNATNPPNCTGDNGKDRHCVTVTAALPVDSNGVQRVALQVISQKGASTNGTWSTSTSRTIGAPFTLGGVTYTPSAGETFKDAAHEAGHMMGLGEDYDEATGTYGNSIMGRTWGPNAKPTQAQIDQIVENNCSEEDKKCPSKCCCGNGKVDTDIEPKEECDPKATPTGCEEGKTCTDKCKCEGEEKKPVCGDGKVEAPEECDPKATPTGCPADKECVGCVCKEKEKPTPEPPPETPTPEGGGEEEVPADETTEEPTEEPKTGGPTCGDQTCNPGEDCSTCDDCLCYQGEVCSPGAVGADYRGCAAEEPEEPEAPAGPVCGDFSCDPGEDCFSCVQDCSCPSGYTCDPGNPDSNVYGCYLPEAVAFCGDGSCDPDENCSICGDCVCGGGEICDPSDPSADYRGCAPEPTGPVCGDGVCDLGDEDCAICPSDCGCGGGFICDPGNPASNVYGCFEEPTGPICGDGLCDIPEENCSSCPGDCMCPPGMTCGPGEPESDPMGCFVF